MNLYFYDISTTGETMPVFSSNMKYQTLARYLNCSIDDIHLHTNEHGKPFLPDQSVYFNISHTENLWVMAVHTQCPIGIDIERHKPRKNMDNMIKEYFHTHEYDAYMAQLTQQLKSQFFYNLWTQKEAYAKYIGLGMAYDFSQDSFVDSPPKDATIVTKQFTHPQAQHPFSLSISTHIRINFDDITIHGDIVAY